MLRVAVLAERQPRERRVALVPEEVSKLGDQDLQVVVEAGAGGRSWFSDKEYLEAGAEIADDVPSTLDGADLVVKVQPPTLEECRRIPECSALLSFLPPGSHLGAIATLAGRRISAFSFDLVPRTSRAQAVDALSSQASVAGYQAALVAASRLGRMFPMMMTAAGTIPPARVLVIGAGVAGLQSIATCRRLGASVSAYDVRPEAAEEVRSLGATFVDLPLPAATGAGGYAAEQSPDSLQRQQAMLASAVARADAVITTAAVPGRPAPRILTATMVGGMRPGSVIVDLAAGSGGNCELTVDGGEVSHRGVVILGAGDLASEVATHASALYARNVANTLRWLVVDGKLRPESDDEILSAICMTSSGVVRHEPSRTLLEKGCRREQLP